MKIFHRPVFLGCVTLVILACLCLATSLLILDQFPQYTAQAADTLRDIFGNETVAKMEMVLFQVQDLWENLRYHAGIYSPGVPWKSAVVTVTPPAPVVEHQAASSAPLSPTITNLSTPAVSENTLSPHAAEAIQIPTQTPASLPVAWHLAPIPPLGKIEGEGLWEPYILDPFSQTLALRTFLQPDPDRPYAILGVVAFNLQRVRLHFVLGSSEPFSPNSPRRSGKIPTEHLQPGILLATFNGGFKATHGQFGAMADHIIALPPKDGLGTLAIYADGRVQICPWTPSLALSPDIVAWRQNGPLVIQDSAVNPQIISNSPKDWGYTVNDVSPTWRSGIGVSADQNTLYYFAGSKLSMSALAQGMLAAGAANALQLDINNYWVHFVAIRVKDGKLVPEPLFPEAMKENLDRYLNPYTRDFFYITLAP